MLDMTGVSSAGPSTVVIQRFYPKFYRVCTKIFMIDRIVPVFTDAPSVGSPDFKPDEF